MSVLNATGAADADAARFDVNSRSAIASAVALGTVGVLSFIIQPAEVQGFVSALHMSDAAANDLAGREMMGVALATVVVALVHHRLSWRVQLAVALLVAVLGNGLSALAIGTAWLAAARFAAGLGHGAVIALSFTFIGLTARVERNLALYLVALLSYGALGIWFLPAVLAAIGFAGLFAGFAALCALALLTVRLVPRSGDDRAEPSPTARRVGPVLVAIGLAAVLAYNIAMGIAWANLELIGTGAGLPDAEAGFALGVSQILAVGGALAAVFFAERLGRFAPVSFGILLGAAAVAALIGRPTHGVFLVGVCALNVLWNFVLPFILAAVTDLDPKGRLMTPAISLQMIGLGFGPNIAGLMLGAGGYARIIELCVTLFVLSWGLLLVPMLGHRRMLGTSA